MKFFIDLTKLLLFVFSIQNFYNFAQAISPNPLYQTACVILESKIYCFFGANSPNLSFTVKVAKKNIYTLDLNSVFDLNSVRSNWTEIADTSGFITDGAIASTIAPISDTTCVIDGGYNLNSTTVNITKAFDISTTRFSSVSNANRNLSSPIYMGTAISVPNQKKVYYWGGVVGDAPGTQVTSVSILDVAQSPYSWSVSTSLPSNLNGRFGHSATLDKDGKNIFYIGGKTRLPEPNKMTGEIGTLIDIRDILIYNTASGSWRTQRSPSQSSVYKRYLHTATLIPDTNQIIIYGGANDQGDEIYPQAVNDYFYFLDTTTFEFSVKEMTNEANFGPGPRFGHSALVYKDTLFILFGINSRGELTDETYFLNINNSTWLSAFPRPLAYKNNNTEHSSSALLDAKAIIGISIGSVLIIILLIIGLFYTCYLKTKKEKTQQPEQKSVSEDDSLPQLHKEYQKRYSANFGDYQVLSASNSNMPIYVDISSDSTTLHDSTTPPRGFSTDQFAVPMTQKPNQVKDQQPSFREQQHTSSNSSFQLSPIARTPNSPPIHPYNSAVVKPSI